MAAQEFNCPNCGAPIDYDGSDTPTVRCPFCSTSVMVPTELRPAPPAVYVDLGQDSTPSRSKGSRLGLILGLVIGGIILFSVAMAVLPLILVNQASKAVSQAMQPANEVFSQLTQAAISDPTETPTPIPTPTPSFAALQASFASKGIGPGLLNDARYLGIDGSGTIYAADYEDGRIQAFDSEGKFLHGWQVGDAKTIIDGLTVNHDGVVFVAYDGIIERYDGAKGKSLGKVRYANGPEFGDLAITPDGGIVGVWYEGRWGMITSLEGHRDDLVWFDAQGKTQRTLENFISGQTQELALDTLVAVDGLGTIYALSDGIIYKFSPQGKYLDQFTPQDDSGSVSLQCLAVDGKGNVVAAGSRKVFIFSPDGRLVKSFDTKLNAQRIAFSENGDMVLLSSDQIARYKLAELP